MADNFTISAQIPRRTVKISAQIPKVHPWANALKYRLFEVYPELTYPQILEGLGKKEDCPQLTQWLEKRSADGTLIRTDGDSGKLQDSTWSVVSSASWAAYAEQCGVRPYSEAQKQAVRDRGKGFAAKFNPK